MKSKVCSEGRHWSRSWLWKGGKKTQYLLSNTHNISPGGYSRLQGEKGENTLEEWNNKPHLHPPGREEPTLRNSWALPLPPSRPFVRPSVPAPHAGRQAGRQQKRGEEEGGGGACFEDACSGGGAGEGGAGGGRGGGGGRRIPVGVTWCQMLYPDRTFLIGKSTLESRGSEGSVYVAACCLEADGHAGGSESI